METIDGKSYLTVTDLVDRLKISRPTALRYIKQGKLEAVGIKGKWYVTPESLQEYLTPKKHPLAFTNRKLNVNKKQDLKKN